VCAFVAARPVAARPVSHHAPHTHARPHTTDLQTHAPPHAPHQVQRRSQTSAASPPTSPSPALTQTPAPARSAPQPSPRARRSARETSCAGCPRPCRSGRSCPAPPPGAAHRRSGSASRPRGSASGCRSSGWRAAQRRRAWSCVGVCVWRQRAGGLFVGGLRARQGRVTVPRQPVSAAVQAPNQSPPVSPNTALTCKARAPVVRSSAQSPAR